MNHSMPGNYHEEADTKILLHLQNALQTGSCACLIIITGKFRKIQAMCPATEILIDFGTGKNSTYFHINAIALALGEEKSTALPQFPQLHWLRHGLCLFWQRKSVFMGWMEMLSYNNRGFQVHCRKSFRCHGDEQPPLQIAGTPHNCHV
jgi:hypothetical protein